MSRIAAIAVAFGTTGCAPDPIGTQAEDTSALYDFFTVAAIVVFVVTAGLIAWSLVRYRARSGDTALPDQFHSNVRLEIIWFAIPQIIVVVLFLTSFQTERRVTADEPDGALVIETQGFQWGWRFTYEGSGIVISGDAQREPELVVPVDVPLAFVITSDDVIHSFYVPRFLNKMDAIPGHENRMDMTITNEGTYEGKCAEFCGLFHGDMNFTLKAVSETEFSEWVAEQGGDDGDD